LLHPQIFKGAATVPTTQPGQSIKIANYDEWKNETNYCYIQHKVTGQENKTKNSNVHN
jgi:hypothetical protein